LVSLAIKATDIKRGLSYAVTLYGALASLISPVFSRAPGILFIDVLS
jgi:hypothetical protein